MITFFAVLLLAYFCVFMAQHMFSVADLDRGTRAVFLRRAAVWSLLAIALSVVLLRIAIAQGWVQ